MADMTAIPVFFYKDWYKKDVAPKLSKKQKEALLMKISDFSLEHPMTEVGIDVSKKEFPELAPFMHTEKLSGLQLYAVMTGLFEELHPAQAKKLKDVV